MSDGKNNISQALAALVTLPCGVAVAFNNQLLPARGLLKNNLHTLDPFISSTPLPPSRPLPISELHSFKIPVVTGHPGITATEILAVAADADGVIFIASGAGNTRKEIAEALIELQHRGIAVIVTSRVPHGIVTPSYGGGGGGSDLAAGGVIISRYLRAPQARIALQALLTRNSTKSEISDYFQLP